MLDVRIERKAYRDGREVLSEVAFNISRGEVVALLGPSGAGKSTALRILLGLDARFTGRVRCTAARVGVMFQEPRLLPWLTVAENIRLVVTPAMPPPDVAALLERVDLPEAAGLYPRQISLGMARRVALARALAVSPDLLVLDEPFASLDTRLAGALAAMLARQARAEGTAVLLATHDLAQALEHATRLLVLSGAPASLAADIAVPAATDVAALRARLAGRFAFLAGQRGASDCREHPCGIG